MASRNPQTQAKRARELAVKEKRERKKVKKAEAAALRAAGEPPAWAEVEADPESEPNESDGGEAAEGAGS